MRSAARNGHTAVLRRISEKLQSDVDAMRSLRENGLRPGETVTLQVADGAVLVGVGGRSVRLPMDTAQHLYVSVA